MENLIYSLNATVPVFLVILLGYALRQTGLLNENFVTVTNNLNFKVTLPIYLFCDMAGSDLRQELQPKLILFCAAVTTVMFFGLWFLARRFLKDKSMVGAFVQGSYRSSLAILGAVLLVNIYGNTGPISQVILGCVPFFNLYAILLLTVEGPGHGFQKGDGGRLVKKLLTNPLLVGILAGAAVSFLRVPIPLFLQKALTSVGSIASPQALLCIGAGFEGRKAVAKLKPTMAIAFIKLLVLPGIFLPMAAAMGFRDQTMAALLIMLGAPTTATSYVMAKNMGGDEVLTSSAIVVTTLLSAFTITFWIFLFRQLGYL